MKLHFVSIHSTNAGMMHVDVKEITGFFLREFLCSTANRQIFSA